MDIVIINTDNPASKLKNAMVDKTLPSIGEIINPKTAKMISSLKISSLKKRLNH